MENRPLDPVNNGEAGLVQRQGDDKLTIFVLSGKKEIYFSIVSIRCHRKMIGTGKMIGTVPPFSVGKTREGKSSEGKHPNEGEIWLLIRGSCFSPVQLVFFDS